MIITLDSTGQTADDFTVAFQPAIRLDDDEDKKWTIALDSMKYTYSMRNIDPSFNNNTFEYYNGSAWKTVTVPGGTYGISDINAYFQQFMFNQGDYDNSGADPEYYASISLNNNTQRIKITLKNSYEIRFTNGSSFRLLIGAEATTYNTTIDLTGSPDINRGINSFNVHTDIINGTFYNGTTSSILYNFIPNVAPGYITELLPKKLLRLGLKNNEIRSIRIWFTDQLNRPISFFGEPVTLVLVLEQR